MSGIFSPYNNATHAYVRNGMQRKETATSYRIYDEQNFSLFIAPKEKAMSIKQTNPKQLI